MSNLNVEKILNILNIHLENYYLEFDINNKKYKEKYKVEPEYLYEPTIATSCSRIIFNYLKEENKKYFYAMEFNVPIGITREEIKKIEEEVGNKKIKNKEKMYIDAYLCIEEEDIFIEYKLKERYDFTSLAKDYLKFKIATYYTKSNSCFLYFNIIKEKNGKAVLNYFENEIIKLNSNIEKENLAKANVYIYEKNKKNNNTNEKNDIRDIFKTYVRLETITSILESVANEHKLNEKEKMIISYLNKFKPNVIASENIQKNYAFIKEVYDKILDKNNNTICKYDISVEENIKNIMEYDKDYFITFIDKEYKDRKETASNDGLKVNVFVSMSIISMIEWYCKKFQIETKEKAYHENKKNGKQYLNAKTITENNIAAFNINHKNNIDDRIKKLIEKTVYYIIIVYDILFYIEDNKVIAKKSTVDIIKINSKINKQLKEIKKDLEMQNKEIKECLLDNNKKLEEELEFISKEIIKKY